LLQVVKTTGDQEKIDNMSDSGVSLSGSGPTSRSDVTKTDQDSTMSDTGDNLDITENDSVDELKPARLTANHGYISKSVANLCSGLNLSGVEGISPSVSRSESVCSLASSTNTVITPAEIRALTNNYQKMLKQATKEIKKLNVEKWKLEQEQDKLLNTNIELAEQMRKMIDTDKQWKNEKKNLLDVNEEFASEVEKLYKNEEKYQNKIEHLERQYKDLQSKYQLEKQSQSNNLVGEQAKLEMQIKKLTNSLENMKTDYEQLLESNKQQERLLSNKQEDLLTNQEKDLNRLQKLLHIAQTDLEQERRLKEAGDSQIRMLTTELRRTEDEIKDIRLDAQENEKMKKIREQNEKLTAENFEYAVENNDLKKKMNILQEKDNKLKKELAEIKNENQWIIKNQKSGSPSKKIEESQMEMMRTELKEEKDKVKNLTVWKSQLSEKNKELKEENDKLLNKVEDLERLMNDEVTDINEILNVINTIQVENDNHSP